MKKCSNTNCFVHEGESCANGEMDKHNCEDFNGGIDGGLFVCKGEGTYPAPTNSTEWEKAKPEERTFFYSAEGTHPTGGIGKHSGIVTYPTGLKVHEILNDLSALLESRLGYPVVFVAFNEVIEK